MEDDHDDEIQTFIKVWFYVVLSLVYTYFIVSKLIPKGFLRLFFLLPVFYLFTILPFSLNSFHLGAPTAFYLIWLGNFKLLLFSFSLGPLSSSSTSRFDPSKSPVLFITLACLPIKLKESTLKPKIKEKSQNKNGRNQYLSLGLEALILSIVVKIYDYREYLNPNAILVIYCLHLYLGLEITLAMSGAIARTMLGQDLAPVFDQPYLSNSLQEFWGRRWNLMVNSILRSAVYDPVCCISTPVLGKRLGPLPGVFLTFVVSGLMHEVLYYYMTRVDPTWEVTWFFVIQGVCTSLEGVIKKSLNNKLQLNRWVSRILTLGFISGTGLWLFFPQFIRNGVDIKAIGEYGVMLEFVKNKLHL
ncbi:hypothetical protein MKW98_005232 [Papaver atlanticum]|uniref:Wax synthase domain-containing protein n=1 Tax=Papaver atlanticum TaxID=357466 RepID=A0AAD4X3U1_9MAGN|nr:hypothetical protein MKW98_005232 [Papaver atlanticum]